MDLQTVLRMVRKLWLLVAGLALLGAVSGAGIAALVPPTYAATTRLYFSFESTAGSSAADLVAANNFAVQKVYSYVQVAKTPRVLNEVIKNLKLDTTANDLSQDVTVSAPADSVIISISADAANPKDAATLTNAIGTAFIDVVVNELEAPADGGSAPVRAETLETAVPPTSPSGPGLIVDTVLGLFIGLVVGLLAAVVLAFTDRRVHNRDEVERLLNVRVIGSVPGHSDAARPLAIEQDASIESAAYRALGASVALDKELVAGGSVTVLASTRREPGAAVVANTAIAIAQAGLRVIVVDGDFENRGVSKIFGLDGSRGLADVLGSDEEAFALATDVPNVSVLPAGALEGVLPEALATEKLRATLARFADDADLVLVAAPPVLGGSGDSGFLATATDGALLVVQAGKTDVAEVRESLETLDRSGSQVRVVLTSVATSGPDSDVRSRSLTATR